ncbi:MAG: methylase involved in ubiquinone/menaquinone biosynthesis [Bacteroidota bacterium]|nr:methylase involved in ubiquinone/menaquinone biosynthesis [Bacteroidota bacterium]
MTFQDHFSRQAEIYLKARPTYPDELFEYLAGISPSRQLCWDCATGNGQAAISLSPYFEKVIATDGSGKQIQNAMVRTNIEYKIATAEESGLQDHSVDLITVATAAHWFEHDRFYKEAQRVSKANGILAVWAYSEAIINPEMDALMAWFMYDFLEKYWPEGRWYVRNSYTTLPFPFTPIKTPDFVCKMNWTKAHWIDYIKSWSSYNNYLAQHKSDPLEMLLPRLNPLWNTDEIKPITWKLHLKCTKLNID